LFCTPVLIIKTTIYTINDYLNDIISTLAQLTTKQSLLFCYHEPEADPKSSGIIIQSALQLSFNYV